MFVHNQPTLFLKIRNQEKKNPLYYTKEYQLWFSKFKFQNFHIVNSNKHFSSILRHPDCGWNMYELIKFLNHPKYRLWRQGQSTSAPPLKPCSSRTRTKVDVVFTAVIYYMTSPYCEKLHLHTENIHLCELLNRLTEWIRNHRFKQLRFTCF